MQKENNRPLVCRNAPVKGFQPASDGGDLFMHSYQSFLEAKRHLSGNHGFAPHWMPGFLFDFQRVLVEWALQKGRAAIFADCGMSKTAMQLTWAQNVVMHTNKPVLILTPLAVGAQTLAEAEKFGIEARRCPDGRVTGPMVHIANYERLHYFKASDFVGTVCDESGILKNFDGVTRSAVVDFMRKQPYRLLCTATAAPNDHIELGNSSEALGYLGFNDMLGTFFKKAEKTTSRSDEFRAGVYRFRGHAERDFWRWVVSWARAIRKPSDMGFSDDRFVLPPLNVQEHVIQAMTRPEGFLFDMPAVGLQEEKAERRRTVGERCEKAAEIINRQTGPSIAWCHLNDESNMLSKLINGAVEVSGADSDDEKERAFEGFVRGDFRVLVTKPQIASLGMNFQHCSHQTFFPSHSFEQWYQAVRRSWRFGQKHPVTIDLVTSEGERGVMKNLQRKAAAADRMFEHLVALMNNELSVMKTTTHEHKETTPPWLA